MKTVHFVIMQISNVLAMVMIIYYFLDIYNPMMKFIDNTTTKTLLLIFGVVVLVANQISIWRLRPWKGRGHEAGEEERKAD